MNPVLHCNDIHSRLNPTEVRRLLKPRSTTDVVAMVKRAAADGRPVSVCGARHAMGGQQFGSDTELMDLTDMTSVAQLDHDTKTVEVGAGVTWPLLVGLLNERQMDEPESWSIRQKQSGADHLTIGGALAANIHGRGLYMHPIIDDVEAFTLVDAEGYVLRCSRSENPELFRLAIGGYGCFGIITSVCLRLMPRSKMIRHVEILTIDRLLAAFENRISANYVFGDFQFSIDETSVGFLSEGVFSCYRRIEKEEGGASSHQALKPEDWQQLIHLAHTDRPKCYQVYADHYLKTDGSIYWSDALQMSVYLDHYHEALDQQLGTDCPGSEMISELYVPRKNLAKFMAQAKAILLERNVVVIYGTIRLILKDVESFLAWAQEDFACVIFNLHTDHTEEGISRSAGAFRALIDAALGLGGSFYLTYHRWATRGQLLGAYPQFPEFLRLKSEYDPHHRFQSEWWRHHQQLLGRTEAPSH